MLTEADAKRVGGWTMPFGKYKGKKFCEIDDRDYFEWLLKKTDFFVDNPKYKHNTMIRHYLEHVVECIPFKGVKENCEWCDSSDDESDFYHFEKQSINDALKKGDQRFVSPCTIFMYNGDMLVECAGKLWEHTEKYDHDSVCGHVGMICL